MEHNVLLENAALNYMLHGIIMNQRILAEACGVELPFTVDGMNSLNNMREKSGGVKLPRKLQVLMLNDSAFDMAVKEGYIQMTDDGHLTWMLGNNTLLAYFLGRLFCGDRAYFSRGRGVGIWQKGEKGFPGAELQRLFGVNTLKQLRQKRCSRPLPEHYELIDKLF